MGRSIYSTPPIISVDPCRICPEDQLFPGVERYNLLIEFKKDYGMVSVHYDYAEDFSQNHRLLELKFCI